MPNFSFIRQHSHLKYWPTWLGLMLMWISSQLPFRIQLLLGRVLGVLLYLSARERRHIAEINLRLCFPELNPQQLSALVKKTFIENAIGIFETAFSWWGSDKQIKPLVEMRGLELLETAVQEGKGVLLLGAHYTTLDLAGRFLSYYSDFDVTYRKHKNPVMDYFIVASRKQRFKHVIERKQMRQALKSLKKGRIVWYAGDQDYGRKQSVFVPFFDIPAATITATSRLAAFNQSPVLLSTYYRKADNSAYIFEITAPFAEIPSGDDEKDAKLINQSLENAIRKHPAQYMWMHRRFKTRPDGAKGFYLNGYQAYLASLENPR